MLCIVCAGFSQQLCAFVSMEKEYRLPLQKCKLTVNPRIEMINQDDKKVWLIFLIKL